jgi:Omp85 superfamily domain
VNLGVGHIPTFSGGAAKTRAACMFLGLLLMSSGIGVFCNPTFAIQDPPTVTPPATAPLPAESSSSKTGDQEIKPTATEKQGSEEEKKKQEEKEKKEKRGSFVVAPLPISSPAIGSGIVPVVGYIFPFSTKDKISPPSVIGGAGLVTNNGSRGFAIGGQLYFKEDRYRVMAGFVRGNIDYNVYGNGISSDLKLPLTQTGHAFLGEALRRVWWKFFIGPRFINGESFIDVKPNDGSTVPIPPDVGLHTTLTAVGIHLLRDTSVNRFYPTSGTYFSFTSDFFSQGLGSKYSFQSYRATFDKYWSFGEKQVLAYNAYACGTGGSPPFYGNCIYGTNNELRGYTAGQYFTSYMLATQLEYRLVLPKRFGLVIFGGLGGTIPGKNEVYGGQHFLPAGGGGLRFLLSKKYHVNLRADIAQGVNGHTFSMGVGEAF